MTDGKLVFIGDVHLERDDPALDDFCTFVHGLRDEARRIVLMGDLFTIWVGRRELEGPHQKRVLDVFRDLRSRGVIVRYVEGNRDYRIGRAYAGDALDDGEEAGMIEQSASQRYFVVHGHLANPADRQYRVWHHLSRSAPFWYSFNAIPRRLRVRWVDGLERKMRRTNLRFKQAFPETIVRRYAERWLGRGFDGVVLGHFHTERELDGKIFVLPEWKGSRRHLESTPEGRLRFVDS